MSADASQLIFSGRRPPLAPIILSPLLLALSSLPWLGPPPRTALHVATSLVFGLAASGVAAWAWPRRHRVHLVAGDAAPPGARAVQPGSARWVLDMVPAEGTAPAAYTAALRAADGVEQTVLESTDPERLLRQLSEVLRHWPGTVDCRWGLPESARPWSIEAQSGPRPVASGARTILLATIAPRSLILCTAAMTVLVLLDLVLLVASAGAKLPSIHPLSVVLPVLFGLYLVTFALALATASYRLSLGRQLRKERSLLGVRRVISEVRPETVRGVYALGAPDAQRWHVLVDSADGPLSVSVPRGEAQALARETELALDAARRAG